MENLTNVCEATSQSHDYEHIRPTHRKGKKLLAEKKRRARINNCLMQIRDLVCEGEEEKETDLDKMEKAEILEKTLEVLTRLRHGCSSHTSNTFSTHKAMAVRYASGFSSCAEESIRYIQNSRLVPAEVKVQLQNHLRAITRRMEATVHVENQGLTMQQPYPPLQSSSTSSSSSLSYELPGIADPLREDAAKILERGPSQHFNDISSEIQNYYISSPVETVSPALPPQIVYCSGKNIPDSTDSAMKTHTLDIYPNHHECTDTAQGKLTEKQLSNNMSSKAQISSTEVIKSACDYIPVVQKTEFYYPDSSKDQQYLASYASSPSETLYPLSVPYTSSVMASVNSSVILHHTPVLPASPLVTDQPLYSYQSYESYPTVSSILVQPLHYMSTPIKASSTPLVTSIAKQPRTPNNALDLCVKGNEEHKISPESMWRPW